MPDRVATAVWVNPAAMRQCRTFSRGGLSPEVAEASRRQLGVPHRVLDRAMA
jgi:hypothetical protein